MGLHKQMPGKIGPGSAPKDVYLKDYIERKQIPAVTFGIRQNGNGWSLNFDTGAPDTLDEAIKAAKTKLEHYVEPPKLTFEEWVQKTGVHYHLAARDGDWAIDKALKECWKAAQENK